MMNRKQRKRADEFDRFIIDRAHEFGGSLDANQDALDLWNALKEEFLASSETAEDFLTRKLPEVFKCVGPLPKWVSEPAWPFHEGKPMVFVGQLQHADVEFPDMIRHLYHFSIYHYSPNGNKCVVYTIFSQTEYGSHDIITRSLSYKYPDDLDAWLDSTP